jgi:hypothetical protein
VNQSDFRTENGRFKGIRAAIFHFDREQYLFKEAENRIEIARKIISSVNREMQKPRLSGSFRNHEEDQAAPLAKEPSAPSERV